MNGGNKKSNPREPGKPWNPTGIAIVSLLLSPLPGGVLHALNYARLGIPERRRLALFSNLITGAALLLVPFFIRMPRLAATLLVSAYFYKSQEHLFQRYRSEGGKAASLLVPVILSIVVLSILVISVYLAQPFMVSSQ